MDKSKYLERFQAMTPEERARFQLIGDHILVEKIEFKERKTAGGIITSVESAQNQKGSLAQDRPVFVRVLMVGEGYFDDTAEEGAQDVPLNVEVGDICMVGGLSTKWFSDLDIMDYRPYEIGYTQDKEVKLRFRGQEAYEKFFGFLSERAKKEVAGSTGT